MLALLDSEGVTPETPMTGARGSSRIGVALIVAAIGVAAAAGLIGFAIGQATDEAAVTVTVSTQTGMVEEGTGRAATGRNAYLAAGCSSCHGENAEGSNIAPPLAGHTMAQVRRQVRSPLAQMPAYRKTQLSDDDLEDIAGYIAGLKENGMHVEPVNLTGALAMHHWMALSALAVHDRGDALHHVGHIIEAVKGEHLAAMKEAREHIREGDLHEAEHLIEEMLAGKAKPDLGLAQLYLRLALAAVEQHDRGEALHEMRHFLEQAKSEDRAKGRAVLAHLREGDLHSAEHGIEALLGIE
jgi:mono/diheme cytochrome c family protein